MRKIAISYRRADSLAIAGRVQEHLVSHFGADEVFMDIDAIPFGEDFREYIDAALRQSAAMVLLIGPKWLGARRRGPNRIQDETDPVRIEVETALRLGLRIIPVLVEGAMMPQTSDLPKTLSRLPFINAATLDAGRDFRAHMTRLIRSLETALQSPPPPVAKAADAPVAPPANELRQSAGEQQRVEPRMPEPRVAVEVVARERGWLKPFVASVVVLALSVVAVSVFSHASSQRAAVAFVNGQPIYRDDFLQKLKKGKTTGSALLNQSIQTVLIDQYARNHKIDVSQAQIDAKEAETRAKMQPGQFDEVVKQQGLTAHDVRHILEQQLILEKAVAPKIHVSDADIETYFDKNRAVFDKPEQVRARHILTDSRAKALQVLAGLRAGGNWTTLARQYSTDPSSKNKGGELGFFARAAMVTPFSDAAFNAEVGQLVGPVKTPFGYHIIQVEGRTRAAKATLAASRDQIRATLRQQHEATVVPAFLQQLRSAAKIEIVDPDLKDALASPAPAHS